jgi:hypothetical protein
MKTNSFLFFASFAVFAASASAASNQSDSEIFVLPKYVVTAPRHQPVEQQINASLNELREQAQKPASVCPDFAALRTKAGQNSGLVQTARNAKNNHVAKL